MHIYIYEKKMNCVLKFVNTIQIYVVLNKPYKILSFPDDKTRVKKTTKTVLAVCSIVITLCASYQAVLPGVWLQNYFNVIKVNKTKMS